MPTITTGSFPKALAPGVKAWFGQVYSEHEPVYTKMFEKETSTRAYEEFVQTTGFGLAAVKAQGAAMMMDDDQQGYIARLTNVAYGLGFGITHEAQADGQYLQLAKGRTWQLARSFRETKEINGANIYNRAFNASYTGADGVALCSTAHPRINGGTWANKPTVDVDLSEAALEDALIAIKGLENDRGLKINPKPKSLIVATAEEFNAYRILNAVRQADTTSNNPNAVREMGVLPGGLVCNPWLTSPHAWFIRTDVTQAGLIYQEREALSFDISNDAGTKNMNHYAYERYVFGWGDPLAIYGVNGP